MSTTGTVEVVAAYLAAVEARDPERLRALLHDDLRFTFPASLGGTTLEGPDSFIAMLASVGEVYRVETMRYEREPSLIDGDRAACPFTLEAETVRGLAYRNRYVILLRVAEGRIIEIDEHLDSLYAERLFRG